MSIKKNSYEIETDVLVIGGGLAGLCAAIEAAGGDKAEGADVLLLEKQPRTGGSSELSGGLFAFSGTDMQKAAGIVDDEQRLYDDIRRAGQQQNDEKLVRTYVAHQTAAYEWLKSLGTQFKSVELGAGQSAPRAHSVNSQAFMDWFAVKAAETPGVRIERNAQAQRLLTGAGGRVEGVMATVNGRAVAIRARRGVVLAAGGFARNAEMVKLFVPLQTKAVPYCGEGSTGDGVRMAWALGAGLADMAHIKGTFGFHPDTGKTAGRDWSKHAVYRGAIAVNKHAQRYVDESQSYKLLGDAVLMQPGALAHQIFDQSVFETATDEAPLFRFREALALGRLLTEPTLEALAKRINLDPAALAATVARYNGFVRNGRDDDFGRTGLSTTYGKLVELKRGPWYAYPSTSGLIATYCGVTIDTEARVLNVFGEVIPGLYAAGEMTGGFHGVAYMTGSSLGKCVIFGRIAGRNAAG
jgi:fumarate reductase flavoprotein subunit